MRYTVLPRDAACQAQIVDADEYAWGGEYVPDRIRFWRKGTVVEVIGEEPLVVFVAEFAPDWVAGVLSEGDELR